MFYTKYRPQKFIEISQPNDTAVALMNQVKNQKTVHAYLFVGPRGTGKTTTARILAKSLNCENSDKSGDPCGTCKNCESILKGSFIDLIEIDAASNRGIDDIRDLRDKVKLAPSMGKTKVYIIDEVHMLTNEAFNALLKTLEEPPMHTVFILCTTEFHKVPDTIKSRCQVFKFKRATKEQLVKKLEVICKAENVKNLKKEDLEKIADASFGGFRDAETILQQVVEGGLDPQAFVGLSAKQNFIDFVQNLMENDKKASLKHINRLLEQGLDLNVWTIDLLNYMRDLLFIKNDAYEGLLDETDQTFNQMKTQAQSISSSKIVEMIEEFMKAGNEISNSPVMQLPLELAILKVTTDASRDDVAPTKSSKPPKPPVVEEKDFGNMWDDDDDENEDGEDAANEKSDKKALKNESETESEAQRNEVPVQLEEITQKWPQIIKQTVKYNHSIHALLKAATPVGFEDKFLVLEVSYAFHKERLETAKNRKVVESVISELTGYDLGLKCKINAHRRPIKKSEKEVGELTDLNVIPAGKNIMEVFDGGLSL